MSTAPAMDTTQRRLTAPNPSFRCLPGASLLAALLLLAGACDATAPMAGSASPAAAAPSTAPQPSSPNCPATDIAGFVAAFAESPALQKVFTAPVVDTAFVDWSAQPEPAEAVEPLSRDLLRFPVMPNRARQQADGLQYREIGRDGDRTTIALEVPDTDLQLRYTFRRDGCWTLVKIVDPAFGKAFDGDPLAAETPEGSGASALRGLSQDFSECIARAGSQNAAQAECLTAERDRQDARLNAVYGQLTAHLQGERRSRIVEAQRAWVQLQQKDEAFAASFRDQGGPTDSVATLQDKTLAIAQRADLLVTMADFSGDVPIDGALRSPRVPKASDNDNDVPEGLSDVSTKCMARAEGHLAQADCLTDERERQDARLNKVYKQLTGRLQGERRDSLVAAQRAWVLLQQHDTDVGESILDELGQIGSLQSEENEARAIARRADLLERYLDMSER